MAQTKSLDSSLLRLRRRIHYPGRLRDVRAAKKMLHDLKLLAKTAEPHFPSLFGAAGGKPAGSRTRGFGRPPSRASWLGSALSQEPWALETKLLRGKTLFVYEKLWPSLDAYVRPLFLQIRRGTYHLAVLEQRILDVLHVEGPTRTDILRGLLDLGAPAQGRAFQSAKNRLQALGLVVGSAVAEAGRHQHVDRLGLWTHRFPRRLDRRIAPYQGLAEFLRSAIHASVYVPERIFSKWWAWPRDDIERALEVLINGGAVLMVSIEGRNGYTTCERAYQAFREG